MKLRRIFSNIYLGSKIFFLFILTIIIVSTDFSSIVNFRLLGNDFDLESTLYTLYSEGNFEVKVNYNDPNTKRRKVFITRDTNEREAERVIKILSYLDTLDPKKSIDLYLDSNGGSSGYTIANFFRFMKAKVNVYVLDWCASACVIVLAGATG